MKRRELLIAIGGAVVAWPLAARAQQKKVPVIGYLNPGPTGPAEPFVAAFRQGLGEAGYFEGQNVAIEYRGADGSYDRLPELAADLVGRKVDVIVTNGPPGALAARGATSTIPIVFNGVGDPIGVGLVANLARPERNLTGFSILTAKLIPKLVELLSELVPQARVDGFASEPEQSEYAA